MTVTTKDLHPNLATEISGFDPIAFDQATLDELRRLRDDRSVLVIRGIDLEPGDQSRIVELIYDRSLTVDDPDVGYRDAKFQSVSNRLPDGGAPYGRLLFHSDMMWSTIADQVPSLYAVEVEQPSVPTLFASTTHAWDTLPDDVKARVAGLHARHESGRQGRGDEEYADELLQPHWDKLRDTVTLVANPHPRTGKIMLSVCEQQTREIVELPEAESNALLDRLFAHLYQPDQCYSHQWQAGDFVIWDNQGAQHGRPFVVANGPARTLRKVHAPRPLLLEVGSIGYDRVG
jgi:taurine dioxygenase